MRNTLILFLVALALGAYVYFYEYKGEEQRQKAREKEEKLIAFDKAEINAWEVDNGGERIRFEKKEDRWYITAPVNTDADVSTVNAFLGVLTGAKKIRTFSVAGKNMEQYGLKNPRLRLRIQSVSGRDSIYLGGEAAFGDNIYAARDDSLVMVTPATLKRNAQKSLFDWRDKKALHFDKEAVKRIELKTEKGTFRFVKEGMDWQLTLPVKSRADQGAVRAMLNKLDFGRILSVAAENAPDLSVWSLKKPAYRIDLYQGENQSRSGVSFSRPEGKMVYGKDDARPHIFKVDTLFMEPFNKTLYGFREKKIADFRPASIRRIVIRNGDETMTFVRDTSSQWIAADDSGKVRNIKITTMLSALSNLKARSFVDGDRSVLRKYGLSRPTTVIELYIDDNPELRLEFGREIRRARYARNALSGQIITVKQSDIKDILLSRDDLFKKK